MDTALTWFIRLWVGLAILVNLLAIVGLAIGAESWWDAWQRVTETYSPFNVINYAMEVALISPAIGAYIWRERRRERQHPT